MSDAISAVATKTAWNLSCLIPIPCVFIYVIQIRCFVRLRHFFDHEPYDVLV
jgi:hypothetical protein